MTTTNIIFLIREDEEVQYKLLKCKILCLKRKFYGLQYV